MGGDKKTSKLFREKKKLRGRDEEQPQLSDY